MDNVDTEWIMRVDGTSDVLAITSATRVADALDFQLGYMGSNNWYLDGSIDEFRISDSNRTDNWLALEYNNMQDNANFGTPASA
jgi:hypothetical protein